MLKSTLIVFVVIVIVLGVGILAWNRYLRGVESFRTVHLGMSTAEKAGDSTGWAAPYSFVHHSLFYVYVLHEPLCIGADCGMGGYFVECLGGWLSSSGFGDVEDYGLYDTSWNREEGLITVANEDGIIVGIYPGARIQNLPYLMRNHRDLVSPEVFKACSASLPSRWM